MQANYLHTTLGVWICFDLLCEPKYDELFVIDSFEPMMISHTHSCRLEWLEPDDVHILHS
jgi:hypothetical protein